MAEDFIIEDDEFIMDEIEGENIDIQLELERFRQQWHQEIQNTRPITENVVSDVNSKEEHPDKPTREDEARFLYMQGVNAEQSGKLCRATQFYRRAIQLEPDIEFKIEDFQVVRRDRKRIESESSTGFGSDVCDVETDEEMIPDLIRYFHFLRFNDNELTICKPCTEQRIMHISFLPFEILTYIFKWVVSADLDVVSLEKLALVCRGFYLCARDEELWRLICLRTWGKNCGSPTNFGSYRNMYIERPHLCYNGCYISRSTYFRQGERSLDNYYRPFHLVEYYRYIRFFPEGTVFMLTSPDDPYTALPNLRTRGSYVQGLLSGYYKLSGDRVSLVLKRKQASNQAAPTSYRYRRQRNQQPQNNDGEQTFHAELTVQALGQYSHRKLSWANYSVHTLYRSTGEETITEFELNNNSYPNLIFSPVRSFTAISEIPL